MHHHGNARTFSAALVLANFLLVIASPEAFARVVISSDRVLTGTVGGNGGEPFRVECDDGLYLAGLQVRYGNWIDAVGNNCATATTDSAGVGHLENPGSSQILLWGGTGGAVANMLCDTEEAVAGIAIQRSPNNFVGYIAVRCTSLKNPGAILTTVGNGGFGRITSNSPLVQEIDCPSGMVAIGIHGAAGGYVDRLGLVCTPAPQFFYDRTAADQVKMHTGSLKLPPDSSSSPTTDYGGIPSQTPAPIDPTHVIIHDTGPMNAALDRCKQGFVWREAKPDDHVCVTPDVRERTRQENAAAPSLVDPNGAYGPASCVSGYVWREAYEGDTVCVTPDIREQTGADNQAASSRLQD